MTGVMRLALLLLLSAPAWASRIHGYVLEAGSDEPLIGANVMIQGEALGAASNLDGYFVIVGVEPGRYELSASYQGYRSATESIVVVRDLDTRINLHLEEGTIRLEEVVVTAEQTERELQQTEVYAGKVRLDRRQMELAPPMIERDVFRAFQTVPGVLPSNDFSSDLNVRGSRANENLILLDGVEVYNPNHLGGMFSAFIPSAVKHADLLRSGWSAVYGGRTGAVFNVTNREGNHNQLDAELTLGALSTSACLSAPVPGLKNSSWLMAGRRSYIDLATKAFTEEEMPYFFTDAQGRFNWDPGINDRISFTGYYGEDVFSSGALDFRFGNQAGNLNWRHIWNSKWYTRAIVSHTRFRSIFDAGGKDIMFEETYIRDWSLKLLMEYHPNPQLSAEMGVSLKNTINGYEAWIANTPNWDVTMRMAETAGYVSASWEPHPLVLIEPGLRVTQFASNYIFRDATTHLRWEPRLGTKVYLTDWVRLKAAWGLYHQGINQYKRDGSSFDYVWIVMDETGSPTRASHSSLGLEMDLPGQTAFEIEAYYKEVSNVAEGKPIAQHEADDPSSNSDIFWYGLGKAMGMDLSLKRTEGLWTGSLGYSLGWAWRELDELNEGESFYASYDKRHNMNMVLNRNFLLAKEHAWPCRWVPFFKYEQTSLSLTTRFASGPRYSEPVSGIYLGEDGISNGEAQRAYWGSRNGASLPAYNRVDIAWKMIRHKKDFVFEMSIGVLNLFNSPNYYGINYTTSDENTGSTIPVAERERGVARMPSLELTWRFR